MIGPMSPEELTRSSSHGFRPIVTGQPNILPDGIGYAEVINAGKSRYNEDTASCLQGRLTKGEKVIKYTYIGLFDGHGGPVNIFFSGSIPIPGRVVTLACKIYSWSAAAAEAVGHSVCPKPDSQFCKTFFIYSLFL
jgi:hypothetical protein